MVLTSEQILNIVKTQTNKSDEEINEILETIKNKYEGLLSDVGAAILLSKQLNVDVELKQKISEITKVSEITTDIDSISLYARVKSIPLPRTYKAKDGTEGKVQSVFLEDETGYIKLNLWQDKADIVKELNLEKNDLVFVKDAGVSQYNERTELSLRFGGQIIKDPKDVKIPKIKENLVKISEISSSFDSPVDIIGRITNIFPLKTFTKEEKERFAINFELHDGKKAIRCAAFDDYAKHISSNLLRGDLVRLNDVTIREGLYDLELYVNWSSSITKDPKTTQAFPNVSEIHSEDIQEEKISNLEDGKTYKVSGTVVGINKGNLVSYKCPTCKTKVFVINEEFICEACNAPVNPDITLFSSITVDDSTGTLKISFFNQLLEKIYDLKKEELKLITPEKKDEIFYNVEKKFFEKKITASGRVKMNSFSNQLEMIADNIELQ